MVSEVLAYAPFFWYNSFTAEGSLHTRLQLSSLSELIAIPTTNIHTVSQTDICYKHLHFLLFLQTPLNSTTSQFINHISAVTVVQHLSRQCRIKLNAHLAAYKPYSSWFIFPLYCTRASKNSRLLQHRVTWLLYQPSGIKLNDYLKDEVKHSFIW